MSNPKGKRYSDAEYRLSIPYDNLVAVDSYINSYTAIMHKWTDCGHEILLIPTDVTRKSRKISCSLCKGTRFSIETYKQKVFEKHGDKIKVLSSQYVNAMYPLRHKCMECGHKWETTPDSITGKKGTGCFVCKNARQTKTHVVYVKEAKKSSKSIVVIGQYTGAFNKIEHKCSVCDYQWTPFPVHILRGGGCPRCRSTAKYSQASIKWLNKLKKKLKVTIQHAENIGEFIVPGTRWRVDGYAPEINTVFEFYGDAYHGNPILFGPNEYPHPFKRQLTTRTLYRLTRKRHKLLEKMGYKVIHVWETDFKKGLLQSKRL